MLGVGALFSGAALVSYIVFDFDLRIALGVTLAMLIVAVALVWRRATPRGRSTIARVAAIGAVAGIVATIAYDTSRWALSQLDPSEYQPFEALRGFGHALTGEGSSATTRLVVGTAFHALNGVTFGVAFAFLFGRRGILFGIGWGLVLELVQVSLYPGWLDIRAYDEFVRISALGHIVYGATLGWLVRVGWRRAGLDRDYASRSTNAAS